MKTKHNALNREYEKINSIVYGKGDYGLKTQRSSRNKSKLRERSMNISYMHNQKTQSPKIKNQRVKISRQKSENLFMPRGMSKSFVNITSTDDTRPIKTSMTHFR